VERDTLHQKRSPRKHKRADFNADDTSRRSCLQIGRGESSYEPNGPATTPPGGGVKGVTVGLPAARESGSFGLLGALVSDPAQKQEFQLSYPNTMQPPDLRRFDISTFLSTYLDTYTYVN
jgi:hypothetical protein